MKANRPHQQQNKSTWNGKILSTADKSEPIPAGWKINPAWVALEKKPIVGYIVMACGSIPIYDSTQPDIA